MNQKKLFIAPLLLVLAQMNAQQTVATSGGNATGSGGTASYTVGQAMYTTSTGTAGSLSSGVQQDYSITAFLGTDNLNISLQVSVYPNPVVSQLSLKIKNTDVKSLSYQLYDLSGRIISKQKISAETTSIEMGQLPPSTFILKVLQGTKDLKTFKIIKK
ncbi:Por secretion system C-terminal sorting domain-containing protein [Chryseobacterium piscicola]|uniref:Por secretion system C-terminal sorting domain-containing protein n=1 Tax=Chryseobacterium piscicola TaxID=551459 RepID=A0A1N7N932_9FLAO|nr:T9SS type A sorting domain-containing protein [Chryseobacterium piscicola]PQA90191.1 hypothetical protein B0A70_14990 [Chryseobacterium piscicola]SIS94699.1 Por secretion system C-terminal sorting domain-containing protein [Chryseobacterium piscicola]